MLVVHGQAITAKVNVDNISFQFTAVYAKCSRNDRKSLWQFLSSLNQAKEAWFIGGDFNTILQASEKKGGNTPNLNSLMDFNEFIVANNLTEVDFTGNSFTWTNNQKGKDRIWERLDRYLMNGEAALQLPPASVIHLTRQASDHKPILLKFQNKDQIKGRFIYQRFWGDHKSFLPLIQGIWGKKVEGSDSYIFAEKLRRVREGLKAWNWEVFGNVNVKLKEISQKIDLLELQLQSQWSDQIASELEEARNSWEQYLLWQRELLRQKSRIKWLGEGDKNTKFYHAIIRERRQKNKIQIQDEHGNTLTDTVVISQKAVEHFGEIFQASPYFLDHNLFNNVQKKISETENKALMDIPQHDEIYQAVLHLSPDSAPGNDGFTGHFFRQS